MHECGVGRGSTRGAMCVTTRGGILGGTCGVTCVTTCCGARGGGICGGGMRRAAEINVLRGAS